MSSAIDASLRMHACARHRGATVILLCHKLNAQPTTHWTGGKVLHQESGDLNAQCGDGIWVMALGANSSLPAAGSREVPGRRVAQDGRVVRRGKNGSFPLSETHKPPHRELRGGEIPA